MHFIVIIDKTTITKYHPLATIKGWISIIKAIDFNFDRCYGKSNFSWNFPVPYFIKNFALDLLAVRVEGRKIKRFDFVMDSYNLK